MKSHIIFLFTLGIVGVFAKTIAKTTSTTENIPLLENIELETKKMEATSINKDILKTHEINADGNTIDNGELEIVFDENINKVDDVFLPQIDNTIYLENHVEPVRSLIDDLSVNNAQEEIMETAEGFIPIPIRSRQPARRRFATRRHFKPKPYWSYYNQPYFYPYLPFYYPSSLRYYQY